MRASSALALALCTTLVSGCEPLENLLGVMTNGEGDAVTKMKAQDAAYITYQPATQEPPAAVEPEPLAPPVCDPTVVVNLWRGNKYNCEGQIIGSYDIG